MTPQTEFLNLLCDTIEENVPLEYSLSPENQSENSVSENIIYINFGEGITDTQYYDKTSILNIPVHFFCKGNTEQDIEQLSRICNYLQRLKAYPNGTQFKWVDVSIRKQPGRTEQSENNDYRLSCIINCKIYF